MGAIEWASWLKEHKATIVGLVTAAIAAAITILEYIGQINLVGE